MEIETSPTPTRREGFEIADAGPTPMSKVSPTLLQVDEKNDIAKAWREIIDETQLHRQLKQVLKDDETVVE